MSEYVPAVDPDGDGLWFTPNGVVIRTSADNEPNRDGWRRLYVREEPAPFEHSDMCEDGDDGEPPEDLLHLDPHDGGCLCTCPKCGDSEGYCICPMCSRPASHPHAAVTP